MERKCTGHCLAHQMRIDALNFTGAALNGRLLPTQQSVQDAVSYGINAEALLDAVDGITQCNGVGGCGATVEIPA